MNTALVAPDGTVTDSGTVRFALSLARVTAKPSLSAARFSVTLHWLDPGVLTLTGVQVSPLSVTGAMRFRVKVRVLPFQLALIVAL